MVKKVKKKKKNHIMIITVFLFIIIGLFLTFNKRTITGSTASISEGTGEKNMITGSTTGNMITGSTTLDVGITGESISSTIFIMMILVLAASIATIKIHRK